MNEIGELRYSKLSVGNNLYLIGFKGDAAKIYSYSMFSLSG